MKSATILLVAVAVSTTMFLECSTAAVDSTTCKDTLSLVEFVKEFLDESLEYSQMVKLRAIKIIDDALLRAKGHLKETLNEISIFLKDLLAFCTQLREDMNAALESGCIKDIAKVSAELSEEIAVKVPELIQLIEALENAPKYVREGFEREMKINLANDVLVDEILKAVLAGVYNETAVDSKTCKDTVTFEESVKKYLDESMGHSQRAKLRAIKIIDDALIIAKGDVKETLNEASIWLKDLLAFCMQLEEDMNAALKSGCINDLAKVTADFSEALAVKEPELQQWIEALKCAPKDVQEGFEREMKTTLDNDVLIVTELKRLLACVD